MTRGGGVVAVLAVVVLAGCTSPAAKPSTLPPLAPSASPSVSPSPAPSPTAVARPRGSDLQQIVALARDFYEERNRAIRTGDTKRLRTLSTPTCQCLAVVANIEKIWKSGSINCPAYYSVNKISGAKLISPTTGFVNVLYKRNRAVYLDHAGKPTQTFPADKVMQGDSVDVVHVNGRWMVDLVSVD